MRYRQLLVFVTVYEEKSVSRAAEKLCITQSQASRALKEIQEEYQVILSNRTRHGLAFTPAAREFYHHAKSIVSRWQEMEKSLKRQDMAEDIRLGSSISIGTCMLPALVKEYTKRYPNRNVYVTVNSADIIEHMVARDQLDFALTEGSVHEECLTMEPYLDDELVLICGQDSPLASHQTVSIHDIAEEKLLLREKNSATREMAENILTSCGLTVLPAWESSSTSALVNAVALGLGISILPRRFVQPEIDSGKVVPLELAGVEFKRTYNIIYLRDRYLSPAALDFLALVDDEESKVKLS